MLVGQDVQVKGRMRMPKKTTSEQARADRREGKAASTQAGEFVREELHHVREGKHGVRSTKQLIAIALSKARRAGVRLRPPGTGKGSARTRQSAKSAPARARSRRKPSARRSRATRAALGREGRSAVSRSALARQARSAAQRRGRRARVAAARAAARSRARSRR
jgi:hypothetical protein